MRPDAIQRNDALNYRRFVIPVAALAIAVLAVLVSLTAPSPAYAKEYSCPSVNIDATVNSDGSLSVTESREFSFDGDFTAVWWEFGASLPSDSSSIVIDGVSMSAQEASGSSGDSSSAEALSEVPFEVQWREAGGPGTTSYSFDEARSTLYVFFDLSDTSSVITVSYTITNFVQLYDDVAELYWQFIGHGWAVDSSHVTASIHLPAPSGANLSSEDGTVRAWAHGPLDGTVSIQSDGTVTLAIPRVSAGGYAEARVLFPVDWMSGVSATSPMRHTGERLDAVLDEETRLANQANAERLRSLAFIVACLVISIGAIVWAIWMFFRHGKEYKPKFREQYWRDVPDPSAHPAVIGRLWRWDAESQNDFTATLMHLSHEGALRIDAGTYQVPDGGGQKTVQDYYITRLSGWEEKVEGSPIDAKAMKVLFEVVGKGADSLWFGTVSQYGQDHPEAFVNEMNEWQGVVSSETNKRNFFEAKGNHYQGLMRVLGVLGFFAGLVGIFMFSNFIPMIAFGPAAVVLFVVGGVMSRRSKEAVELYAKCEALRNWLKDFSALDERLPTDVKVWGDMMVYAYLFGVAEEAIKALQTRLPNVVNDPGFMPVYYWVAPHYYGMGTASSAIASPMDMFSTMQANTMSVATAAMSGASGGFSSGGGFGGGGGGAR